MRKLVDYAFRPRAVERMRGWIASLVDELVDELRDEREFDFVVRFASPLPVRVICDLFGVFHESRGDLMRWSEVVRSVRWSTVIDLLLWMTSLCHLESSHGHRPTASLLTPSSACPAQQFVKQNDQSRTKEGLLGLENRWPERPRGFESLPLGQKWTGAGSIAW